MQVTVLPVNQIIWSRCVEMVVKGIFSERCTKSPYTWIYVYTGIVKGRIVEGTHEEYTGSGLSGGSSVKPGAD